MKPSTTSTIEPAVLFVNIGWADEYNGEQDILGNHRFLREHPDDNSEHAAFRRRRPGVYSCGIGPGGVGATRLDIVFVARKPRRGGHFAVGLYRAADCMPDDDSDPKSWVRAVTTDAYRIPLDKRPEVAWPGRMGMRRWARRPTRSGTQHEHLLHAYRDVLELRQRLEGAQESPKNAPPPHPTPPKRPDRPGPLTLRDDADLLALTKEATASRRQLHNKMTNALGAVCGRHRLRVQQGNAPHCRYDALIIGHDGADRDLLIELKASTEPAFCRMAVGQLLDYRRALAGRDKTDLAVLLPNPPERHVREFLADVGVILLWFAPDFRSIQGDISL